MKDFDYTFIDKKSGREHLIGVHHTTGTVDAMYRPTLSDFEYYHVWLHEEEDDRMDPHTHEVDTCPAEHTQFGSIEKCPWCQARRCPLNMPDHIAAHHHGLLPT
jgi:hypothetical protein